MKYTHNKNMSYFNYHGIAKNAIKQGKLIEYKILPKWNNISPALVLFFTNRAPMPIREEKWNEYLDLIHNTKKE